MFTTLDIRVFAKRNLENASGANKKDISVKFVETLSHQNNNIGVRPENRNYDSPGTVNPDLP